MKKTASYAALLIALVVSLFPFYFMFVSSSNSNAEILQAPPALSFGTHLISNLQKLIDRINLFRVIFNSLFITLSYTALSILIHSMAGFALVKYEFKFKKIVFPIIMLTMMIPPQVLYVPLFTLMNRVGWINTYQAVIFPTLANAFGIFLMRQNMISFPNALLEAARIDGCSEVFIFFRIVLPNMKSALGALGIYMFLTMWNSFMWPLIVLGTKSMYNFPVALSVLDGFYFDENGKTQVNSSESVRAMEMMKKIHDAGITVNDGSWEDYVFAIKDGQVATVPEAVWMIGTIKDVAPDTAGQWRVMPLPRFAEGENFGSSNGGGVLAIPSVTQSPEAALAFVKFAMTDKEALIQGFRNYGLYPSYIPIYQEDFFLQGDDFFGGQEIYALFSEIGQSIPTVNYTQNFAEVIELSKNAVAKILLKDEDIEQTMDDLQEELVAKFGQ